MKFKRFFPILQSVQSHTNKDWRRDILAGITVAVMLVPQGMAYSMLAGMPPIYGLYAGLIPLFIYGVMGTSRQMSVGPVAVSALLVLAGVSQIANPDTETATYIQLVILCGFLIGLGQTLLGVFRLGFLVSFISHPVIVGFTSAAAIIIIVSQLKDLLGFPIPRFSHLFETLKYAAQNIGSTKWISVVFCLGSIFVISLLKKIHKSIPSALVVVVVGILLSYFLKDKNLNIDIVGAVPEGLPMFQIPSLNFANIKILLPTVFTVIIIGIVESIGIAKVLQSRHQNYSIRPNQELFALGISKMVGSFFQAIPSSGSFSRSAVNDAAGAKSGVASITAALIVGLTLLFFTKLFFYLPKAVLAGIILLAVKSLFDWKEAMHLWKTHRSDFYMMLTTFVITLVLGIEEGVLAGVVLSICMVLYRSSKPHVVVLGNLPGTRSYRNLDRFENAGLPKDEVVIRFDDQLYFGNADYFQDTIKKLADELGKDLKIVLLDFSSIHEVDSTGIHALQDVYHYFSNKNVKLYLACVIGPVRDQLTKSGITELIGEKNQFLKVHDALLYHRSERNDLWKSEALQTNVDPEE